MPEQGNHYTTLVAQKLIYWAEIENKSSQTMTWLGSAVAITTPASIGLGIILAIPKAVLTAIDAAIQTNQFDTDPAGYTHVTQGIIR